MTSLRDELRRLDGRVCLMGLGNTELGDDGFGVRLAERLQRAGLPGVLIAGTMPERFVGGDSAEGHDHVVFLDAAEFGGTPGSAVLLNAEGMVTRFPQVSTHKLSLGLLARLVEGNGTTRAWLLGVQPETVRPARGMSASVEKTLAALEDLLCERWVAGDAATDEVSAI